MGSPTPLLTSVDVKHACRILKRARGQVVAVLVTIVLGLGANAVVFMVGRSLLFSSLPYPRAQELVALREPWQRNAATSVDEQRVPRLPVFQHVAGYRQGEGLVIVGPRLEHVAMAVVTNDFFSVFSVPPLTGRTLDRTSTMAAEHGAVISERLAARLSSNRADTPDALHVNGRSLPVLGVMPGAFNFPAGTDIWLSEDSVDASFYNGSILLSAVARLRPGVTLDQARAAVAAQEQAEPRPDAVEPVLVSLHAKLADGVRQKWVLLQSMAAVLLLVAVAAVAHAMATRLLARRSEFSMRLALGAPLSAIRMVACLEVTIIYIAGGVAAMACVWLLVPSVQAALPVHVRRAFDIRLDGWTILSTMSACLLLGVGTGLIGGGRLRGLSPAGSVEAGVVSTRGPRGALIPALLALQVALTTSLLVNALWLAKSWWQVVHNESGVNVEYVSTFQVEMPLSENGATTAERLSQVEAIVRQRSQNVAVGSTSYLPFRDFGGFLLPLRAESAQDAGLPAHVRSITPGYLEAVGVRLLEGRGFDARDGSKAPRVALVNQAVARRLWPEGRWIGRRLWLPLDHNAPYHEVVGVVGDIRHYGLDTEPEYDLYLPMTQAGAARATVLVRTTGPPLGRDVVRNVADAVPNVATFDYRSLADVLKDSYRERRQQGAIAIAFALLALLIAATTAYSASEAALESRKRDMAIRLALGAGPADVVWQSGRGILLAAAGGLAVGLLLAAGLSPVIAESLYRVKPHDAVGYAGAAAVVATAILAVLVRALVRTTREPLADLLRQA